MKVYRRFPDAGVVGGRIKPVWMDEKPSWLTPQLESSFGVLDYGKEIKELTFPEVPVTSPFAAIRWAASKTSLL